MFQPDFIIIPHQLLLDENIGMVDERLYGIIYWFQKLRNEKCTASNTVLAKLCGTTPQTIANSLTKLEQKNYIKMVFKENTDNRVRQEIIPLVVFSRVSLTDETCITHRLYEVSPTGEESNNSNSNIYESNNIFSNSTSATCVADPLKVKKDEREKQPMDRVEFITVCRGSKQRHINIIAEYVDEKKTINFSTKGQWDVFLRRNLRAAKALSEFSDQQISKAMKNIDKAKYITKWGLETLLKYLEE
jgi:hypothetical protein